MTTRIAKSIQTVELVAWGLDLYEGRPDSYAREAWQSPDWISSREEDFTSSALCEEESAAHRTALELHWQRSDLQAEMIGLDWYLGVVDLRRLLTFQRRLSFNAALPAAIIPQQEDWLGLMQMAFAPPNPVECDLIREADGRTITLRSSNPNLQLRVTQDPGTPVAVHAGSPFFEVAEYAGRWFLRDGYHRAYHLLRKNVFLVPAVVVLAKTLEELGADQPRFFSETIILSHHPPRVTDFLDDRLTIHYDRPPAIKTLRITMEESMVYPQQRTFSGE